MKLPGPVEARLIKAIADGYTIDEFTMFLAHHLERDFDELASPSKNKRMRLFLTLRDADRKGWTCALLDALAEHAENPELREFAGALADEHCARPGRTPLSEDQIWILCNQVSRSFTVERLEEFVADRLGRDLGKISSARQQKAVRIFKLVDVSQKEGWATDLVDALHLQFPDNSGFEKVAAALGLIAEPEPLEAAH